MAQIVLVMRQEQHHVQVRFGIGNGRITRIRGQPGSIGRLAAELQNGLVPSGRSRRDGARGKRACCEFAGNGTIGKWVDVSQLFV